MLEKFYLNDKKILDKSLQFFQNSNPASILKIGVELEFFLLRENVAASEEVVAEFIANLKKFCIVEKERGVSQIEIKTDFTSDLQKLCADIENKKLRIKKLATEKNLIASFASQPFSNDCGNALQFNLSLHDENGQNLFFSDEKLLQNYVNSLLSATNFMMIFLAPEEEDYQRFSKQLNIDLFKKGKFTAPVNLSFGNDNRTCAIRIKQTKTSKRLEFRIAASTANPYLAISALIIALTQKSQKNFPAIFGNAFDEKYKLEEFCKNRDEALRMWGVEENFIQKKFCEFL